MMRLIFWEISKKGPDVKNRYTFKIPVFSDICTYSRYSIFGTRCMCNCTSFSMMTQVMTSLTAYIFVTVTFVTVGQDRQ